MDMELLHGFGGQKSAVDDLIQSYVVSADGSINTGDFVEFVSGQIKKTSRTTGASIDTLVDNSTISAGRAGGRFCSCVAVDDNHVIICYALNSNGYVYAIGLEITGTSIAVGTRLLLRGTGANAYTYFTGTKVDTGKAVFAYCGDTSSQPLYCIAISIAGTTLTIGTEYTIDNTMANTFPVIVAHTTTKLTCVWSGTSGYLKTIGLSISGLTITGTSGTNAPLNKGCASTRICRLNDTQAFILYHVTGDNYTYGAIITNSSGTPSLGTPVQVYNVTTCSYLDVIKIDDNTVLAILTPSDNSYIIAKCININGTLSCYSNIQIQPSKGAGWQYPSAKLIDTNKVLFTCNYYTNNMIYSEVLTILPEYNSMYTTPTDQYLFQSTGVVIDTDLLSYDRLLVVRKASNGYLNAFVMGATDDHPTLGKVITHEKMPNAIALQSGNSGDTIKCLLKGIAKGFTGLTPNETYYCDDDGTLTASPSSNPPVGVAISDTELLINNIYGG